MTWQNIHAASLKETVDLVTQATAIVGIKNARLFAHIAIFITCGNKDLYSVAKFIELIPVEGKQVSIERFLNWWLLLANINGTAKNSLIY
jgi:hypothetical protein